MVLAEEAESGIAEEGGEDGQQHDRRHGEDYTISTRLSHVAPISQASVPLACKRKRAKFLCQELVSVEGGSDVAGATRKSREGVLAQAASTAKDRAQLRQPLAQLKPCKWFLRGQPCPTPQSCGRRHEFVSQRERNQAAAKQASVMKHLLYTGDGIHGKGNVGNGKGTRQHSRRGMVLGEWLVRTFGLAYLKGGTGVIDVAGGKQFVSRYLALAHGIRCSVIDPRTPAPLTTLDEHELTLAGTPKPVYFKAEFNAAFVQAHPDLIDGCRLIFGQHPDEATEPIVAEAVRLGKPFAVVPCCVFPGLFPRALPDGRPVTQYEDFLDYLCHLGGPRVRRSLLDLGGRNVVLFAETPSISRDGAACSLPDGEPY